MSIQSRMCLVLVSLFLLSHVSCMAQSEKIQMLNWQPQQTKPSGKSGIVVLVDEDCFFKQINRNSIKQKNVAVLLIPGGFYKFGITSINEKAAMQKSQTMNIGAGRYYYIERTKSGDYQLEDISFLRNVKDIKRARKAFRIIGDCYLDQKDIKKAVVFYHVALKLGDEDLEPFIRKMEETLK